MQYSFWLPDNLKITYGGLCIEKEGQNKYCTVNPFAWALCQVVFTSHIAKYGTSVKLSSHWILIQKC